MMTLSTKGFCLLVGIVVATASVCPANTDWPLKQDIDLSSGFGDYRPGHFHFGVDLRTGGIPGKSLFSPVDGYVMRVRTAYFGYGKALYIKGDDGFIYVFGHLSNFAVNVDRPLKAAQVASRRYYQDIEFPQDSIRVSRGEFIAYSGQSGVGAPHLQFEVRTPDNIPVNPLLHGFDLSDKTRPVFSRVGFQMTDDRSLFDDGTRKMFFEVTPDKKAGRYTLDTVLYFHRPLGILVDCFDRMRAGGMKQAVYKLSVYIDDRLFYEVVFDSLDFVTTEAVKLEYDYLEAVAGRDWVRSLFEKTGNTYQGSRAVSSNRGVFGLKGSERIGLHRAKIVAEDCFGNRSQLTFEFLWGPLGNVFTLDSTVSIAADTTQFYFSPVAGYEDLKIDSVKVFLNRQQLWGPPPTARVLPLEDGKLQCEVIGFKIRTAVLRLFLFTHQGCLIRDNLFNGLLVKGTGKISLEYEIIEDGLLVTINSRGTKGSKSRVELYYRDSLLGIEYPRYFNMNKYICFVPPRKKYARIDRLDTSMSEDTAYGAVLSDSVHIVAVGFEEHEDIAIGKFLTLHLGKDNFYKPRYLELKETSLMNRSRLGLNSAYYQIFPEAFVCRKDFDVTLRIPSPHPINDLSGLCWLDEEENRWVWLDDNQFEDNVLTAKSTGGGIFAAVFDHNPPRLKYLSVADGRTYGNRKLAINFVIEDTLSGIGDDEDIIIKLDGKWLIPEYDPETGQCRSKPLEPLSPGKHHLGIRVTDRAGNLAEQYLNFFIKQPRKRSNR